MKIKLDKNDLLELIKEKYDFDDVEIVLKDVERKRSFSFVKITEFDKIVVNLKSGSNG